MSFRGNNLLVLPVRESLTNSARGIAHLKIFIPDKSFRYPTQLLYITNNRISANFPRRVTGTLLLREEKIER
jgi:hypothetical protein